MATSRKRRSTARRCAHCGVAVDPATAFLSGSGPSCDDCHRDATLHAKHSASARAGGLDVLLYGLLAAAGGLAMVLLALTVPPGPRTTGLLKMAAFAAATAFAACFRAFLLPAAGQRARLGRLLATLGATAGFFGLIAFIAQVL